MKAMNCRGGEFACVGTFRPHFVDQLHLGHLKLAAREEKAVWKALKVLGQGARDVMKVFTGAAIGEFGAMELRQGTLLEFYKEIKTPKVNRDGAPDRKLEKREKENEKAKRKPCRKGGIMNPRTVDGVVYWEFKAG